MLKTSDAHDVDLGTIKSDISRLKTDLQQLAGAMVDRSWESARAVRDRVSASAHSVEKFAAERPMTTVLIGFAAGVLAGILLRRK